MFSDFKHALPLSVGELAEAKEFARVAARGLRLLCSEFEFVPFPGTCEDTPLFTGISLLL